jgi:hypothetical protein
MSDSRKPTQDQKKEFPEKTIFIESINGLIIHCRATQQSRLGDLSTWEPKRLLGFDQMLTLWIADAFIRMVGIEENPDRSESEWWEVFEEAVQRAIQLSVGDIENLAAEANDGRSIVALVLARVDRAAIRREIIRRLEGFRIGKSIVDVYLRNSPQAVENLKRRTKSAVRGMSSRKAKRLLPHNSDLIWALDGSRKPPKQSEDLADIANDSLSAIIEVYEKARQATGVGDWSNLSPSICAGHREIEDPRWNVVSQKILKEQIEESLWLFLPVLNGDMEKAPMAVYNAFRTRKRRWHKEPAEHSENIFSPLDEESEDDEGKLRDKLEFDEIIRRNRTGWTSEQKVIIENMIDKALHGARKASKIKEALGYIFEGDTEEKACEKAGLTDRTIRDYLNKLRELYLEFYRSMESKDHKK